VVAIAGTDAILMRHRPVSVPTRTVAEKIGLRAAADGGELRVEWNRASRPVRHADRAVLYIEDGSIQSRVNLTGRQLDCSTVLYWPETDRVNFRLEVYRGQASSSESTACGLPRDAIRRKRKGADRAIVEKARPSPFERVRPEIVTTETLPPPKPIQRAEAIDPSTSLDTEADERSEDGMISKIPPLPRVEKHPQSDENEQR
jgi:hypothetical protein